MKFTGRFNTGGAVMDYFVIYPLSTFTLNDSVIVESG